MDHRIGQCDVEQVARQALDQVEACGSDLLGDALGERPVVHGVAELVGGRRAGEVALQRQVDDEGLSVTLLLVEHAVAADDAQAADLDSVGGQRHTGAAYCDRPPGGSTARWSIAVDSTTLVTTSP